MDDKYKFSGKNEEEALIRAQRVLGLERSDFTWELVAKSKGLLGMVMPTVQIEVTIPPGRTLTAAPGEPLDTSDSYFDPNTELPAKSKSPESSPPRPQPEKSQAKPQNGNRESPAPKKQKVCSAPNQKEQAQCLERDPEEYRRRLERTQKIVPELITLCGYPTDSVLVRDKQGQINLVCSDSLSGNAELLESLLFIVNKIINRFPPRFRISIDGMTILSPQDEETLEKARRWIRKVEENRREYWVSNLNPRERRLVHMEVSKHPSLASKSEGEGRNRRLCIYLSNP